MAERLGFIDIGARGGISPLAIQHKDRLIQVLVEPEAAEAEKLRADSDNGNFYRVLGMPLAHINGKIDFHSTINPYCSSVLPVNHDFLDQHPFSDQFKANGVSTMTCTRYDTVQQAENLPLPHIVKVDVQGFEYQVLQGFGGLLQDCLAIECETHVYPIYKGQKLLHDLVDYLANFDFVLRRLKGSRDGALDGDPYFEMDVIEMDAIFTKTKKWAQQQNQKVKDNLNFACSVLGVTPNR